MKNVLVVSGHTDLNDSVANKIILEEVKRFITEAEIDCLDKLYPDFKIDAKAEQAKLEKAEVVVLQFPMFWYSAPSIPGEEAGSIFTKRSTRGVLSYLRSIRA